VIFDLLFGTAHFAQDRSLPKNTGIGDPVPEGLGAQMVCPLRQD